MNVTGRSIWARTLGGFFPEGRTRGGPRSSPFDQVPRASVDGTVGLIGSSFKPVSRLRPESNSPISSRHLPRNAIGRSVHWSKRASGLSTHPSRQGRRWDSPSFPSRDRLKCLFRPAREGFFVCSWTITLGKPIVRSHRARGSSAVHGPGPWFFPGSRRTCQLPSRWPRLGIWRSATRGVPGIR